MISKRLLEIIEAVEYLINNNITKFSLTHRNIFLMNDQVKLLNSTGFCKKENGRNSVKLAVFCAPEILTGEYIGKESYLWSIGVISYILLCGFAPFFGNLNLFNY